jgi:predicted transcriptional regulator
MLAGMTQAELARSAGVHENIIQRYEAEETDARTRTLEKFVTALEKVGVVFLAETDTHVMGVAVTKKAEDPISTTKSEEN